MTAKFFRETDSIMAYPAFLAEAMRLPENGGQRGKRGGQGGSRKQGSPAEAPGLASSCLGAPACPPAQGKGRQGAPAGRGRICPYFRGKPLSFLKMVERSSLKTWATFWTEPYISMARRRKSASASAMMSLKLRRPA